MCKNLQCSFNTILVRYLDTVSCRSLDGSSSGTMVGVSKRWLYVRRNLPPSRVIGALDHSLLLDLSPPCSPSAIYREHLWWLWVSLKPALLQLVSQSTEVSQPARRRGQSYLVHTVYVHNTVGAHRSYNGAARRWPFWCDKSRGQPSGVPAPVRGELREKEEGEERVLWCQCAV